MTRKEKIRQIELLRKTVIENSTDPVKIKYAEKQIERFQKELDQAKSISEIAERFGYTRRTFLKHIRSDEDLYDELLEAHWNERRRCLYPREIEIIEKHLL